jgi:hypothetical protein
MKHVLLLASVEICLCGFCFSAESTATETGRKLEQASCTPCHSLRLVDSQRLSAPAWAKEVDKMIGWGAIVRDRKALIEYLSTNYSDYEPVPIPARSGDDTARERHN